MLWSEVVSSIIVHVITLFVIEPDVSVRSRTEGRLLFRGKWVWRPGLLCSVMLCLSNQCVSSAAGLLRTRLLLCGVYAVQFGWCVLRSPIRMHGVARLRGVRVGSIGSMPLGK